MNSLTHCPSSVTHSTYTDYFLQLRHPNCCSEITIFTTMLIMHLWQSTMFQSLECWCVSECPIIFFIIPSHVFFESVYVSMHQEGFWSYLNDDAGNTLHMSNLEYSKKVNSFCHMFTQGMPSLPFVWLSTYFWSNQGHQ